KFTLSVGVSFFKANADSNAEILQHILMAAAIMMVMPTLIVFFAAQKYFVQGIVMSGLKGSPRSAQRPFRWPGAAFAPRHVSAPIGSIPVSTRSSRQFCVWGLRLRDYLR